MTAPQEIKLIEQMTRLQLLSSSEPDFKSFLQSHRKAIGPCPFLDTSGACSVYQVRPFSCRALLSTMESCWCGTDFSSLCAAEKERYLASIDRSVVAFPVHYLAATLDLGRGYESEAATRMSAQYGFSICGNLPYLVYLEQAHSLSVIIRQGYQITLSFLEQSGLLHPFLLKLDRHP